MLFPAGRFPAAALRVVYGDAARMCRKGEKMRHALDKTGKVRYNE